MSANQYLSTRDGQLSSLLKSCFTPKQPPTGRMPTYTVNSPPHLLLIYASRCSTSPSLSILSHLLSRCDYATSHGQKPLPIELLTVLHHHLRLTTICAPSSDYSLCGASLVPLIECLKDLRVTKAQVIKVGMSKVVGKLQKRVRKLVEADGGPPDSSPICGGASPRAVHAALGRLTSKWGELWEGEGKESEGGEAGAGEDVLGFEALRSRIKAGAEAEKSAATSKTKKDDKAMKSLKLRRQKQSQPTAALVRQRKIEREEEELRLRIEKNKKAAEELAEVRARKRQAPEGGGVQKKVRLCSSLSLSLSPQKNHFTNNNTATTNTAAKEGEMERRQPQRCEILRHQSRGHQVHREGGGAGRGASTACRRRG